MSDEINVKGLKIKPTRSDLETISFNELIEQKIAPGHLLHIFSKSQTAFLMLRAGEYVDQQWIDKYKAKGLSSFYIYRILNEQIVNEGIKLFTKIKNSKMEEEHFYNRNQLLGWFYDNYWSGNTPSSILDLTYTCYKVFSQFDEKIVNSIKDTSILLYNRSHQIASLSVILSMVMGYMDFKFLSDIYHASFLLDYGLMEKKFTYNIIQACEMECENPNSGAPFLREKVKDGPEYQIFFNHCELGYLKAIRDCKTIANSIDVFSLIRRHHELEGGSGFPYKLHGGVIAEWEMIPLFLDHAVPFTFDEYQRGDGTGVLQRYIEKLSAQENVHHLPSFRLVKRIKTFFETEILRLRTLPDQSVGEIFSKEAEVDENEVV